MTTAAVTALKEARDWIKEVKRGCASEAEEEADRWLANVDEILAAADGLRDVVAPFITALEDIGDEAIQDHEPIYDRTSITVGEIRRLIAYAGGAK